MAEYVFVSFVEYYLVQLFTDLYYFRVAVDDFGGMDFLVSLESFVERKDGRKGSHGNLFL
jgi:hypothetical protein